MIIDSLLVKLGFVADTKQLNKFKNGLNSARHAAGQFAKGISIASTVLTGLVTKTLDSIDGQAKFSKQVGLTVEQLQELHFAANRAGGSNADLDRSLRGLNKSISEARDGMGMAGKVFSRLGISTSQGGRIKGTVQILEELSQKMKGMSVARQTDFAEQLGITRSTLLLLQQGKQGIESLRGEARGLGVISTQQAKKAEAFADAFRNISQVVKVLTANIAIGLAPALTKTVDSFTRWVKENKKFIEQDITAIIKVVLSTFFALTKILGTLINLASKVVDAFGGFYNILQLIAYGGVIIGIAKLVSIINEIRDAFIAARAAALTFDVAAALLPTLVVAGFALIVLAIQDFITWLRGGDSLFGRFLDRFPKFKKFISSAAEGVKKFGSIVAKIFPAAMHAVKNAVLIPVKMVRSAFDSLLESAKSTINAVIRIANKVPGISISQFDSVAKDQQAPSPAKITPQQQTAVLQNVSTTNSTVDSSSPTNNLTFNISGASDPKQISDTIIEHINRESRQAYRNNASAFAF